MEVKSILIVDDEKNIRLTLSQALEPLNFLIQTAVNGEEALAMLQQKKFDLVLLDLKMPGTDGMEVLHQINARGPRVRVIIISAYGTIESAVEAMKLGAVDFIQKPFSPIEIRSLVTQVLEREALNGSTAADYRTLIELCKRHITDRRFDEAGASARKAIAENPGKPEAYNLLGALFEIKSDWLEAQKFYRAALDIDPTYKPAQINFERTTRWKYKFGKIELGPEAERAKRLPHLKK